MRKFLLVFTLIAAWAQQPPPEGPKPHGPMPEPKNLKVLKDPGAQLIPIMRSFTAGLGVECDFCHVKGDFASDDNPHKDIARKMIVMAEHINSNFPDGKMHVTCYTCHRGEEEPKTEPAAGEAKAKHEHDHKH
jgi:Photosynthetic reaction centre cytochrome C subunit